MALTMKDALQDFVDAVGSLMRFAQEPEDRVLAIEPLLRSLVTKPVWKRSTVAPFDPSSETDGDGCQHGRSSSGSHLRSNRTGQSFECWGRRSMRDFGADARMRKNRPQEHRSAIRPPR